MRSFVQLALGIVISTAACIDAPDESETTSAAIGPAVITVDKTFYQYADPVVITWSGLNGNATDWIAISPMGSGFTQVTRWAYTGGATSGSMSLEGPVPGGMYVARAFDNDTYNLMGESDPFQVADVSDTMATLMFDKADYAIDEDIILSFTGMPPNATDWVSILPPGAMDTKEAIWKYTGGTANGSVTFSRGLALVSGTYYGGYYDAKLYLNDTYTSVAQAGPVLIGSLVTTNKSSYTAYEPITVDWTHLPGGPDDWVALSPAGSMPDQVVVWQYTGGAVDGSRTFNPGLAVAGQYVARTYAPNSYFVSGQSDPFDVVAGAAVTVTTDMMTYAPGQTIVVSWQNTPGNANDWIAIAPAGSSDFTVTRWVYTGGQVNGMFAFEGVSAGSYVARAFLNDQYIRLAESSPFSVN